MLKYKTRAHFAGIAAIAIWLVSFYCYDLWVNSSPLDIPISLDPPESVDLEIYVPLRERYELQLEFRREGHSFEELQTLIGGSNLATGGIPVLIKWSLSKPHTGAIVAKDTTVAMGANGWGNDVTYRLVSTIQVDPGNYIFQAQIAAAVPELASLSPKITLSFNWKSARTWQVKALFWVGIINVFVVVPILMAYLIWLMSILIRSRTYSLNRKLGELDS